MPVAESQMGGVWVLKELHEQNVPSTQMLPWDCAMGGKETDLWGGPLYFGVSWFASFSFIFEECSMRMAISQIMEHRLMETKDSPQVHPNYRARNEAHGCGLPKPWQWFIHSLIPLSFDDCVIEARTPGLCLDGRVIGPPPPPPLLCSQRLPGPGAKWP